MTPADAETFGVKDKDIVAVKIESAESSIWSAFLTGPRIETFASSLLGPTTVTLSSQAN